MLFHIYNYFQDKPCRCVLDLIVNVLYGVSNKFKENGGETIRVGRYLVSRGVYNFKMFVWTVF